MATINDPTTPTSVAAVKAASVAPVGTDCAIVVALSPNSAAPAPTGTTTVAGAKTNNAAAPGATNVGALIALANAAAPTWVEGNVVLASVDLAGTVRTEMTKVAGTATSTAAAGIQKVGVVGNTGVALDAVAGAAAPPNVLFTSCAQIGATAIATAAAGIQKVGIVGNTGAACDAVAGAAAPANVVFTACAQIGATATVTAAAGVQRVGIAGSANVALDVARGAAAPTNSLWTTAELRASDLSVTATSVANTTVTATLPAAGAGLFHYITSIRLMRNATAALAGTATVTYTTTNMPGARTWAVGNAMIAGGTQVDADQQFFSPLKSTASNTATTIVAPAMGAAVLSQIVVDYYTGP